MRSWRTRLGKNVSKQNHRLLNFLESRLAEVASDLNPKITECELSSDFSAFDMTEIDSEAEEDVYRGLKSYTGWIEKKVARLARLVRAQKEAGAKATMKELGRAIDSYENQCRALKSRADKFAADSTSLDKGASTASTKAMIDRLERLIREFQAIG